MSATGGGESSFSALARQMETQCNSLLAGMNRHKVRILYAESDSNLPKPNPGQSKMKAMPLQENRPLCDFEHHLSEPYTASNELFNSSGASFDPNAALLESGRREDNARDAEDITPILVKARLDLL